MSKRFPFKFITLLGGADFFVVVAFVSLVGVQMYDFAYDPGVGWHLSTGKYVLTENAIPYEDPFLGGAPARPWISDQWLADVIMYGAYQLGSWPLLYALLTVLYLCTYFGVLYPSVARRGGSCLAALFSVMLAFKIGQIHFILRPVVICFFLFALVYVNLLALYGNVNGTDSQDSKRLWKRVFILFPLLFAFWANIHPTFVVGLFAVGLLPCSVFLDSWCLGRKPEGNERALYTKFALLFGVSCLATLLNPYGYKLHQTIILLGQNEFAMNFYMEWQRTSFKEYEGLLFEIPFVVIALSLLIGKQSVFRWGFFEVLLILAFGHFGLQAVRMLPFFGICVSLPLAGALCNLKEANVFEKVRVAFRFRALLGRLENWEKSTAKGCVLLVLVSVVTIGAAAAGKGVPLYDGEYGPNRDRYPYAAVEALKAVAKESGPIVVGHEMNWGGFITWYGEGKVKGVIDDRTTMLGQKFYNDYFEKFSSGADWQSFLRSLGAAYAVVNQDSKFVEAVKRFDGAEIVHEDEIAVVFRIDG